MSHALCLIYAQSKERGSDMLNAYLSHEVYQQAFNYSSVGAMQAQKAGTRLRSPKPLSTRATLIQNLFSRR